VRDCSKERKKERKNGKKLRLNVNAADHHACLVEDHALG
jgi:hypothetical protein